MKTVRVKFADYYGMMPENIWAYRILSRFYDVQVVARNPDYLEGGLSPVADETRRACAGEC